MSSFVNGLLNGLRRIARRPLRRAPTEGVGVRLTAGWLMMIISSVSVVALGFALGFNSFPLVIPILVGSSVLLEGAGDLAFDHQRRLARWLRIMAVANLALAALALAGMILQITLVL